MSIDTPETILLPRAEFLKSIVDACNEGAAAERRAILQRLIDLREITEAGSAASLALTKWIHEIEAL